MLACQIIGMLVTVSLAGMLTWLAGPSKVCCSISRQEGYLAAARVGDQRRPSAKQGVAVRPVFLSAQ